MPEERKGMVKNPGPLKHIKAEIALCGDNSGWLDTVVLFKYMSGYCRYRGLGLLLDGRLKD